MYSLIVLTMFRVLSGRSQVFSSSEIKTVYPWTTSLWAHGNRSVSASMTLTSTSQCHHAAVVLSWMVYFTRQPILRVYLCLVGMTQSTVGTGCTSTHLSIDFSLSFDFCRQCTILLLCITIIPNVQINPPLVHQNHS